MTNLVRKIFTNTISQIFGKVVTALLGVLAIKMLTNYLSVTEYGQYTTIYQYLSYFGIIADLGLYTIAIREMTKHPDQEEKIFGNIYGLRLLLTIASLLVAVVVAFVIPQYQNSYIPLGVAIASITTMLALMNGTIVSILQVRLEMNKSTISTILGKIINVAVMAACIYVIYPKDPNATAISYQAFMAILYVGIIANIVQLALSHWYSSQYLRVKLRFEWDFWKELLKKTLPYGLALFLSTVYLKIDVVMLGLIRSQSEVGIYGVATKALEVINVLPLFFLNSLLPVLSRYVDERDERLKQLIKYAFDFLLILATPIFFSVLVLSYPIVSLLASPDFLSGPALQAKFGFFYGSDVVLMILSLALSFSFINNLFSYILVSINRQSQLMWVNGGCVVFNVLLNIYAITNYGLIGAAVTTVLSEIFVITFGFYYARKYMKEEGLPFHITFESTLKIVLSGAIMAGVIFTLNPFILGVLKAKGAILSLAIGGIVYVAFLFLFKVLTPSMLKKVLLRG